MSAYLLFSLKEEIQENYIKNQEKSEKIKRKFYSFHIENSAYERSDNIGDTSKCSVNSHIFSEIFFVGMFTN